MLFDNPIAKCLHSGPMHLRSEMMLGVVAIKKPDPVVKLLVAAHAPRERLIRVPAIVPVVPVQVRKAVAEIPERQKKTDVTPVENSEDDERRNKER